VRLGSVLAAAYEGKRYIGPRLFRARANNRSAKRRGDGRAAHIRANIYGWSTAAEDAPAAQLDLVIKATTIHPGYAFAYFVKSIVLFLTKQLPEAIEAGQMAVALDPNAAYGYFAMAQAGRTERCDPLRISNRPSR
jgi:tetratricopeptide (TPR) repeat protein